MSTHEAVEFLAGAGITRAGAGGWLNAGSATTANDIAHEMTSVVLADEAIEPAKRLRIGFGLLDVLGEWWVTVELGWFLAAQDDPGVTAAFWDGYRERLERTEPCEPVLYSLWVEWFEDRRTSAAAFAQVLGNDVHRLREADPVRRRAARVLANSGPVLWADKYDVYLAAKAVPELHPALFEAVLHSFHDVYGSLDKAAGLALIDGLGPDDRMPGLRQQLRGDR